MPSCVTVPLPSGGIMDPVDLKIEANKENSHALSKELKILNQKKHDQEGIQKAENKIEEERSYKNDQISQIL
ncbi:hypothetical protein VP01_976g3 [Puccinia sorghi]|uniref:Uncharacterized protein n=1 Tax=Puccinia sorghi TaxID=27349 RepID=A0A0L6U6D3_9BASI|nr:hypothetical protein VP01_976g3 [Puccinia sorghi]